MPHSPVDLASPGGFAYASATLQVTRFKAGSIIGNKQRRAGHRRTRHGKLILPRAAIVPLLLLANGKLHGVLAAPASRSQGKVVSLAVQLAQDVSIGARSVVERRDVMEGLQWTKVNKVQTARSDPLTLRSIAVGSSVQAQQNRYEALSSMTWLSEDMTTQAVLARRSQASDDAELLAPRLLAVAGTGSAAAPEDDDDEQEAFTVAHPGPPLTAATRAAVASPRLGNVVAPVTSAAPRLTVSALPLTRITSASSAATPTASPLSTISRQPSSTSTAKSVKEQSSSQPWTKSSKLPLYVICMVIGGIMLIFLVIYLARGCARSSFRRSEAKRAAGGFNDGKLTSDAALKSGRSLRRALTRKLAGGSFARRTQEGSVLISVGPDVVAVTARVAAEYERERACFWAAAHAHGASGGDASRIGSSSVVSNGRLCFDPRAALLAAQKRAERSMGAERPIDVRRPSAQTIDIADWQSLRAGAGGETGDVSALGRKSSLSQRFTAGLRSLQARVQGGTGTERDASRRDIKEVDDDEATLSGGHEDKFGSGLFDSEKQMSDARRLSDNEIVPIVINGDASWSVSPSSAAPLTPTERSLPPPPRSRSRTFSRKPIPAELSHERVALSDSPVPGTPRPRKASPSRSPSFAHREAAASAATADRAARAAALRTGSYRHKKASDFNNGSLKHKRSSTLRATASQLTVIPGSRPSTADAAVTPTTQAQRAAKRITTSTGLGSPKLYAQRRSPPKPSVAAGPAQPDKVVTPPERPISPRSRPSLPLPPLFSPLLRNNDSLA